MRFDANNPYNYPVLIYLEKERKVQVIEKKSNLPTNVVFTTVALGVNLDKTNKEILRVRSEGYPFCIENCL